MHTEQITDLIHSWGGERTSQEITVRHFSWAEVVDYYRRATTGKMETGGHAATLVSEWQGESSFYGPSSETVREWLSQGYDLPPMPGIEAPMALEGFKPRWRWTDDSEGEYQHDAFTMGDTEYYLKRDAKGPRPGINVEFIISLSAGTKADVIAEYSYWVGRAIAAIQAQGFDMALSARYTGTSCNSAEAVTRHMIQVSKFGETIIQRDFSALFSPAGFRHLMFLAICWADYLPEGEGVRTHSGLGSPADMDDWDVQWDGETRTLVFGSPKTPRDFPSHDMTRKLAEIQALI